MRANSVYSQTAASHCDADASLDVSRRRWESSVIRGSDAQQTLAVPCPPQQRGPIPPVRHMRIHSKGQNKEDVQAHTSAVSESSHRISGEIAIELSPATDVSNDVEMSGNDSQPVWGMPASATIQQDCQRPAKLPKQAPGRANSMAQSITRFFRRAKPAPEMQMVDAAHIAAEAPSDIKLSRKRRLGHLQPTSFQNARAAIPSCHGLVAEADQPNPARRIPGMFKAKRMLATQFDAGKQKKEVKRPTLASTVFAGRYPQTLQLEDNEPENYTISSTLQSVFDVADTCEKHENRKSQLIPCASSPRAVSPTASSGMLPCCMAPHITSPTATHLMGAAQAVHNRDGRLFSGLTPSLCTPEQSTAGGRCVDDISFESVHTPPEVALSAVLECPGAPVKKRGDADAFEVVSRLSSLSVDSIDMCGSPFAPGAPAWSPRAEVRRALRFD